jgi:hypothetical protein
MFHPDFSRHERDKAGFRDENEKMRSTLPVEHYSLFFLLECQIAIATTAIMAMNA